MIRSSIPGPAHATVMRDRPSGGVACGPRVTDYLADKLTAFTEFKIPSEAEDHLIAKNEPECIGAELLRTLASRLSQAQGRHPLKKLLVTSAIQGEGKTLIAANLSITLALYNKRVLLVDGDLRSSSMSRWFDIVDDSLIQTWRDHGLYRAPPFRKAEGLPLWVLPAGKPVEMPGSILQSSEFSETLAEIGHDFDWVIIDSPPLVPFADAGILAALADAVLLVTRRGVTPKAMLEEALETLDKKKIIATILNGANVHGQEYYHDYYGRHQRSLPSPDDCSGSKSMLLSLK
jgi:capsular exopolysaccharide synthesis family protein